MLTRVVSGWNSPDRAWPGQLVYRAHISHGQAPVYQAALRWKSDLTARAGRKA
jgi:hypothetical protein